MQDRLIDVPPEDIEEFELAVTGASKLHLLEDLQIDQDVTITLTGKVREIRIGRRLQGRGDEAREILFRKAVVKADEEGVKVSLLVSRPANVDANGEIHS